MQGKKLLILVVIIAMGQALTAQDYHWTQFYMSPLTLNPAKTGQFSGTARIGGIYRDQYASVVRNQFSTPSIAIDAPIIRGFRKRDWIGIGAVVVTDRAGSAVMKRTSFGLGGAYHLSLSKKGNAYLSVGGQYGNESRELNRDKLQLEDHLLDNRDVQQSNDYSKIKEDRSSFTDINAGVQLTAKLNKKMDMNIGFSMFHVGRPNYGLLTQGVQKMPRRALVHGQFNVALNEKVTISPAFLFQTMAGADEIIVQGMAGYLFNEQKDITLNFGLSYRLADALNLSPMVGMKYKNLRVGFAYDINTGSLADVSARGGFEIAAEYIIKIYKPSVVKPQVLCPRF